MGGGGIQVSDSLEKYALFHARENGEDLGFIYDVMKAHQAMGDILEPAGVTVRLRSRVMDVEKRGNGIKAVVLDNGDRIEGDAFVDATGRTGFQEMCATLGQGCVLCALKCPLFGDCVHTSEKAGVSDVAVQSKYAQSGIRYMEATMLLPDSVAPWIIDELKNGPLPGRYDYTVPKEMIGMDIRDEWLFPDRAPETVVATPELPTFIILYTPWLKVHINLPTRILHRLPGLETAFPATPLSAEGNAVFVKKTAPCDNTLKVNGLANLFAGGERARPASAMTTCQFLGDLAGHNAARVALGLEPITIPSSTLIGLYINEVKEGSPGHPRGHSIYSREKRPPNPIWREKGFLTTDKDIIRQRVEDAGIVGIYERRLA